MQFSDIKVEKAGNEPEKIFFCCSSAAVYKYLLPLATQQTRSPLHESASIFLEQTSADAFKPLQTFNAHPVIPVTNTALSLQEH